MISEEFIRWVAHIVLLSAHHILVKQSGNGAKRVTTHLYLFTRL